jgi:zinc protease
MSAIHRSGLILTIVLLAQAQDASAPRIEFEKYTLPNGLQVILHVDRKLPVVHVNQWFHVGSSVEQPGKTGFAHLFEHMMFQGSKNADKYLTYAEQVGANLSEGGVNGTTSEDRTNYFITAPSGNLETILWLESDRLATLPEGLTQEKLDNQRDVVKNERRQSLENQLYGRWLTLIVENLYPSQHPYGHSVIGSHADLTAASTEDVKEFFRTYYIPNNLSLVIAGDFDPARAKRLVEKYFGGIPAGPALDRPVRWIPKLDGERIVEVKDRVPQERTYFAWHSPALFDAGDSELDLVSTILTDGLSARLNKLLVYDKQLCSDANAFQMSRELGSNYVLWVTAKPGASLRQIEQFVSSEISRLAKEGPTPAELNRAKNKWEFTYISGLERIGGFGGKADLLNSYNTYFGDPNRFQADLARYRNATIESVRQTVARWLDTPDRLLVRFHPETSSRESKVSLDRSKQPPLGGDRPFRAPDVQSAQLENGMKLYVVQRSDLPKVAVTFRTRAGSIHDPGGKYGLADLTTTLVRRGTKTRNALEVEDALGDLGTAILGLGGREQSTLSFEILKRNLAAAMAIFADVARSPIFPDSEVEREKKLRIDQLSREARDGNAIASRVAPMLAFGPDHPYGRPLRGLRSTVQQITRADFVKFHEQYWKAGSSALIFTGDISLAEATDLARRHFGAWPAGAAPKAEIPAARPMGPGKVYLVDRQGAAQTVVGQVLPAPPRKSEEYYAVKLANAVWGGGFATRLNLNLRESKGYSYGVSSSPVHYANSGAWVAQGGVQTDKTKESVVEFQKELSGIAGAKPITDKELSDAKVRRIRAYAQQFESLSRIGGQIADLWVQDLPMAELQREAAGIDSASLAQVNAVAQKYAAPGSASLLLVGDLAKIESGVRELNLGEIVVLDPEGKPGSSK